MVIGSVLPDLIDKPLGRVIFAEAIGSGRIIGHSLLFIFILLVIAVVIWRYRGSIAGFGLSIGALVHQLLDSMWKLEAIWFYPLYGPFPTGSYAEGYAFTYFWRHLHAQQEWLALILLFLVGIVILAEWYEGKNRFVSSLKQIKGPVLTVSGTISLGLGILVLMYHDTANDGWFSPLVGSGDPLVFALALIWCGVVFLYLPLHRLNRARNTQ